MENNPITADGIHQTSRDVLLGHALAGLLANPNIQSNGRERRATVVAKLAIEAVDELLRIDRAPKQY